MLCLFCFFIEITRQRRINILPNITQKVFQPPSKTLRKQMEIKKRTKNPVLMTLGRLIWRVCRRWPKMTILCLMVMLLLFNIFNASLYNQFLYADWYFMLVLCFYNDLCILIIFFTESPFIKIPHQHKIVDSLDSGVKEEVHSEKYLNR